MSTTPTPTVGPLPVVQMVEEYVRAAHHRGETSTNMELLDESGVWSLHQMAAQIYALGFADGNRAEAERQRGTQTRDRAAHQKALRAVLTTPDATDGHDAT